jgi:hypothetical protein
MMRSKQQSSEFMYIVIVMGAIQKGCVCINKHIVSRDLRFDVPITVVPGTLGLDIPITVVHYRVCVMNGYVAALMRWYGFMDSCTCTSLVNLRMCQRYILTGNMRLTSPSLRSTSTLGLISAFSECPVPETKAWVKCMIAALPPSWF